MYLVKGIYKFRAIVEIHARLSMMHLVQPDPQALPCRFTQRWAMTLMHATSMLLATHPWLINDYKVKTSDIHIKLHLTVQIIIDE